jgi:phage tail-like protein
MLREYHFDPYPIPAFYFLVGFYDSSGYFLTSFQEVSGIGGTLETEAISENGVDGIKYNVPKAITYGNLVMKRGLFVEISAFTSWCRGIINNRCYPITLKNISVKLLDCRQIPLNSWTFHNAYPVKWSLDPLNSMENKLAVETIEFKYNSMEYR